MPCCQERLDISRAKHQLHDACTSGGPCTDLAYSSWPNFWDKFRSGKVRFQSTAILQHHILRDIASTFTMLHCYSYIYCMGMFLDMAILTEFSIILGSAEKKTKKRQMKWIWKTKNKSLRAISLHMTAHVSPPTALKHQQTTSFAIWVKHHSPLPQRMFVKYVWPAGFKIMWEILKFELNGLILGSVWYSCCNRCQVPLQLQDWSFFCLSPRCPVACFARIWLA